MKRIRKLYRLRNKETGMFGSISSAYYPRPVHNFVANDTEFYGSRPWTELIGLFTLHPELISVIEIVEFQPTEVSAVMAISKMPAKDKTDLYSKIDPRNLVKARQ